MSGLQQTFDAARPRYTRRKDRYAGLEIALHWATALLVVTLYTIAQIWSFFPKATHAELQSVHVSLGVLLAVVLLCRIVWRAGPGRGLLPATTGLLEIASKLAHYMLYVLLAVVVGFGLCMRWAGHGAISFSACLPSPRRLQRTTAWRICCSPCIAGLPQRLSYWRPCTPAPPCSATWCCATMYCSGCCRTANRAIQVEPPAHK